MSGEFLDEKGEPFRYEFARDAHRLERVSILPGLLCVPPRTDELYTRGWGKHTGAAPLPKASIVVGEPGSGMSSFSRWLQDDSANHWHQTTSFREACEVIRQSDRSHRVSLLLDRSYRAAERVRDEHEPHLLAELAAALENPPWSEQGRLVLLTRNVAALRDNPLFSSILARGMTFRPPQFSPKELVAWLQVLQKKAELAENTDLQSLHDEGAKALALVVKRWTGGQPLITHYFFLQAEEALADPKVKVADAFEDAGSFLRDHRPHFVAQWLDQLSAIQEKRREALPLLRNYSAGCTKNPARQADFEDADVDLFLAGWVGVNEKHQWGIRSECHCEWVRAIL